MLRVNFADCLRAKTPQIRLLSNFRTEPGSERIEQCVFIKDSILRNLNVQSNSKTDPR